MHPLIFVAGAGISAAGLIAKFARNDKRMWQALEAAAGSKARTPPDDRWSKVVRFPSGVTFARRVGNGMPTYYDVEAPADLPSLPAFRISNKPWKVNEVVPRLLGEGLFCGTSSPRAVAGFIDESLRGDLRSLQGDWMLQRTGHKFCIRWVVHGLSWTVVPPDRLLSAVRIVEGLGTRGQRLLAPFERLSGASRDDASVVLKGVQVRIVWWQASPATELTLRAPNEAEPFVVNWSEGERSGPFPHVPSPSFDTARLRFDGEALHLTVRGAEPSLAELHVEYLHRLQRAMSAGSSPFR